MTICYLLNYLPKGRVGCIHISKSVKSCNSSTQVVRGNVRRFRASETWFRLPAWCLNAKVNSCKYATHLAGRLVSLC